MIGLREDQQMKAQLVATINQLLRCRAALLW